MDTPLGFMAVTTPRIDSGKLGELASTPDGRGAETVFAVRDLTVSYSGNVALSGVDLDIQKNFVTAFIGPSGCGKSTFIRCFNRMNDLVPGARVEGEVLYHGRDLYAANVDPVEVRRRIGMVFQKPNPFPKSIYDNIAFGPRVLGHEAGASTSASSGRCDTRPSGTRSRTGSRRTRSGSRAASSSACASRARSRSSPT